MAKNKYIKIRVDEEELFKITENAGREGKTVASFILGRVIGDTAVVSIGKAVEAGTGQVVPSNTWLPGVDEDTRYLWEQFGLGLEDYLRIGGKGLDWFMSEVRVRSASQADARSWAAFIMDRLVGTARGIEGIKKEVPKVKLPPGTELGEMMPDVL